jgi:ATP-binding cassette subfamily F protein uup
LSYHEQRELASLPSKIEQLEAAIAAMHQAMADPGFYRQPGEQIAARQARLKILEGELASAYTRWEELDELAEDG